MHKKDIPAILHMASGAWRSVSVAGYTSYMWNSRAKLFVCIWGLARTGLSTGKA